MPILRFKNFNEISTYGQKQAKNGYFWGKFEYIKDKVIENLLRLKVYFLVIVTGFFEKCTY